MRKSKRFLAMGVAFAMSIATVTGVGVDGRGGGGPVGAGFTVTAGDLSFILKQIKIAERHTSTLDCRPSLRHAAQLGGTTGSRTRSRSRTS